MVKSIVYRCMGLGLLMASIAVAADSPPSVTIPDSPGAADLLAKALDKQQQHQWRAAAEFYEQILTTYPARVAPIKTDADAGIFRYAGLTQVVENRIAGWPADGLDIYRSIYGGTASEKLTAINPHDAAALQEIFDRYFATDAGKKAGLLLIAARTSAGRYRAAAWVGERLLAKHPTLGPQRAVVLYATAMAEHLDGDDAAAKKNLQQLTDQHPNDTATIGGHDVVLAKALATALARPQPEPVSRPDAADHWPTFNGPGGRGEVLPSQARPGLSPRAILLSQPKLPDLNSQQRPAYMAEEQQDLETGELMGIMPVADKGELFFQDGRSLYALDADSGLPLPGWARTYGGKAAGQFKIDVFGRARGQQLTVTLSPSRVLAVMGQPDRIAASVGQMAGDTVRLVCLDRDTGKLRWSRSPSDLPASGGAVRHCEYDGTPLLVGHDTVLVIAHGGKSMQFEDCYVVALSLSTGDFKWTSYIGSANQSIAAEYGAERGPHNTAQLAMADGRVFALSNIGTVAALDPQTGRLLWLDAYPRDSSTAPDAAVAFMRNRFRHRHSQNPPWTQNPVIINDGKVFVLPSDGKQLLVYDAGTGQELKRINKDDYDNMNVLLGARGKWVATTSDAGCFCIDWTQYTADHPDDAIVSKHDNFDDMLPGGPNTIFGRGFVTSTDIYVPTRRRLYRIGFDRSGKVLETYPRQGAWGGDDAEQGPGNVLVTGRNVVIAGSTRVDIYTDAELARKKFEQEIAAAPNDPKPRIRFAEVLFAGGEPDAALEMLKDAASLIGGVKTMRPGSSRSMIFSTSLTFAQNAGRNAVTEISATAEKLFDFAATAADTPSEQASYRLAKGSYDHEQHHYAQEVQLCQQILTDPAMRAVSISEDTTAAQAAKAAIDGVIAVDRSAYAPIQEQALTAYHAADDKHDTAALLAVADVYPNSIAATDALEHAAASMEKTGNHTAAINTLVQLYRTTTDITTRDTLLESIARNDLAMPGGVGPAIDRLSRGVISATDPVLSSPLQLPNGNAIQPMSFSNAVVALRKLQNSAQLAALPDMHIPPRSKAHRRAFASDSSTTVPEITTLLRGDAGYARFNRVVTWSTAGASPALAIYPASLVGPPVNITFSEVPTGIAWEKSVLYAWSNQTVINADDTGHVRWSAPLGALENLAVSDDGNAVVDKLPGGLDSMSPRERFNLHRRGRFGGGIIINGGNLRFLRVNGNIIRVGGNGAGPAPKAPQGPEHIAAVWPAGGRVVVDTTLGRILGLNAKTGAIVWQTRPADHPPNQLLVNARFTVAQLNDPNGSQLVVIDTRTGRVIGRRKFGADGTPTQLVNVALSEDATLVYTLFNQLMVKDLDESWKNPPSDITGSPSSDSAPFVGLDQPGQLIVHGGRVLALYDGGKFVRVRDLAVPTSNDRPLGTGSHSNTVKLRLVGSRLYIQFAKSFRQYNLNNPADHYTALAYDMDLIPRIQDMLIGKGDAVLVDAPVDHGPSPLPMIRLLMYGRYPGNKHITRESGRLDFSPLIKDPSGIESWQAVNGGFVYLAGNQVLHRLAGAG